MSASDRLPSWRVAPRTERDIASFTGGAVVQLVAGQPARGDAVVLPIAPATVRLTDRRVVGDVDGTEWSWMLDEIVDVRHGGDPWTILAVPGISDHGISVPDHEAERFRLELERAWGGGRIPERRGAADPTGGGRVEADQAAWPTSTTSTATHASTSASAAALPPPPPAPPPTLDALVEPVRAVPAPGRRGGKGLLARAADRFDRARSRSSTGGRHDAGPDGDRLAPLAALETRDVSAWFGTHHVLDRVSLRMAPGEVTALIGPSGCGKSTYLRILNRMHEMIPSASLAGEVLLDGQDIYDPDRRLTDARRQIGMVFQKPNPFPAMSIYDNVVASFRLTGLKADQDERDAVVESCLRKAGLWTEVRDRLRQPGGGLSGGQQQRLCIARALAIRPRVLLMDEPCSALDPTSTRRIEQTIQELASEVTIVIVTHNMQQARRVSHQCAFFLAEQGTPGIVVEHGPTEAMFDSPQDQRTSDYVTGRFG